MDEQKKVPHLEIPWLFPDFVIILFFSLIFLWLFEKSIIFQVFPDCWEPCPTFPPTTLPPSKPHQHSTFPIFPASPHPHLQLKNSKITTLGLLFFKRRFMISELKSKFIFSPPRKQPWNTGFEFWFANHYTTDISWTWVT